MLQTLVALSCPACQNDQPDANLPRQAEMAQTVNEAEVEGDEQWGHNGGMGGIGTNVAARWLPGGR